LTYSQAVPATRPHVDRDVKRAEILDAAETRLLRDGYEDTAMAAIARDAGVANNAVYWYFTSKDELLAAVLQRRQERGLEELEARAPATVEDRVLGLLAQLDEVANLTAAVHDRAARSEAVAGTHERFHQLAERFLGAGFRDAGLAAADAKRASAAVMAMVEGIHLHEPERDPASRDRLILWTLRRLVAPAGRRRASRRPAATGALAAPR
jgi:AcrR family transcriptional regulator